MKNFLSAALVLALCAPLSAQDLFPDGTAIPAWFSRNEAVDIAKLGKAFRITDYGVKLDSSVLQTEKIQAVIDQAFAGGGGVVVVPRGVFLSGALFFKPNTHLHLEDGATLKGSDDISNFPIVMTRIEGQTLKYFAALVNADSLTGFTISGTGTIDGNGLRYWRAFWLRRQVNPKCTNMDEMRPRLVYISNCKDVQLEGVRLENSPFWTTHLYRCENIKLIGLRIYAPTSGIKAPSSDAVDVDACTNVLIKSCYMSVNDDAVALKGGKGPTADKDPNNGANRNIIIEDCTYGFCHSALTCGSECIGTRNIVLRRCTVNKATRLLWLKMRPDTPQNYEYITVENISGSVGSFLYVKPWTQFFDLKGQTEIPLSYSNHVTMRNIKMECNIFCDMEKSEQYQLSNFAFENLDIAAKNPNMHAELMSGLVVKNVRLNGTEIKH
jgi:polygalacturonase